MKLVTYELTGAISCGILTDNGIVDIPSAFENAPASVNEILNRGDECLKKLADLSNSANELVSVEDVKLLAPIPKPDKLLALAGNYRKHILEAGYKLGLSESPHKTTVPRPFIMPPTAVTGNNATIPWPVYSEQLDHEIELAVVIGKSCHCITPNQAPDCIAGYTIANDISARSVTFRENRTERPWDEFYDWLNGKWSDGFLPLGPCLTTADEFGDPQKAEMELKVNGQTRQKANTAEMIFSVTEIVSFISHLMTLNPGDIIATGTTQGVAMATGKWLKPGDQMECKIQGIGKLKNTIGQKPDRLYKPLKNNHGDT